MRVTAQVKAQTEETIRETARKLFIHKGLDATSTRDIAEQAGVAVGTLFNYFPSKEALAVEIAAGAFELGRTEAAARRAATSGTRAGSLDEELFTLIVCDVRALLSIRSFVREVLETAFSPFAPVDGALRQAQEIRAARLHDAAEVLKGHGLGRAAVPAVMHLYWSLYLGVLSFWAADPSPNQEDTLAVLDHAVRMFTASLPSRSPEETAS